MHYIKTIEEFTANQLRSLITLYLYEEKYDTYENDIMEIGYNSKTGYVYIAYDGGVSIAIFEGRTEEKDVCIFAYDYDTGEEMEFADLDDYYAYLDDFIDAQALESERKMNSD
jgi:hypothetical protein